MHLSGRRWALGAGVVAAMLAGAAALSWGRLADHPATDLGPPTPTALALTTPDLDLPASTEAAPGDERGAISVLVTRTHLLIGGDPRPIATFPEGVRALGAAGLPAASKRGGQNDLYLPDLGNGLGFWRDASGASDAGRGGLAVLADGSTPYRVLLEVLFTAGQAGFDRFDIAVRSPDGGVGWLVSRPPKASGKRPSPGGWQGLGAVVLVGDAGYAIKANGGNVAPGCADVGAGVAVPKIAGAYDTGGLSACLRKVKALVPEARDETRITLVASATVELSVVAATMGALHGTAAEPLFPDVQFGVGADGSQAAQSRASVLHKDLGVDLSALMRSPGRDAGAESPP